MQWLSLIVTELWISAEGWNWFDQCREAVRLSYHVFALRYGFDQIEEKAKSYVDVKEYKAALSVWSDANDFSTSHVHQIRN